MTKYGREHKTTAHEAAWQASLRGVFSRHKSIFSQGKIHDGHSFVAPSFTTASLPSMRVKKKDSILRYSPSRLADKRTHVQRDSAHASGSIPPLSTDEIPRSWQLIIGLELPLIILDDKMTIALTHPGHIRWARHATLAIRQSISGWI